MHRLVPSTMPLAPASRRWSRSRERSICPRRHLACCPPELDLASSAAISTRPSKTLACLFGPIVVRGNRRSRTAGVRGRAASAQRCAPGRTTESVEEMNHDQARAPCAIRTKASRSRSRTQSESSGPFRRPPPSSPSYTRSYPLVAKRGRGVRIEDVDGNEFLDFAAGIAVTSTGHCHPEVVAAIQKQAAD